MSINTIQQHKLYRILHNSLYNIHLPNPYTALRLRPSNKNDANSQHQDTADALTWSRPFKAQQKNGEGSTTFQATGDENNSQKLQKSHAQKLTNTDTIDNILYKYKHNFACLYCASLLLEFWDCLPMQTPRQLVKVGNWYESTSRTIHRRSSAPRSCVEVHSWVAPLSSSSSDSPFCSSCMKNACNRQPDV